VWPPQLRRQGSTDSAPQNDDGKVAVGWAAGIAIDRNLWSLAGVHGRGRVLVIPCDDLEPETTAQQVRSFQRLQDLACQLAFFGDIAGRTQEHTQGQRCGHGPLYATSPAPKLLTR